MAHKERLIPRHGMPRLLPGDERACVRRGRPRLFNPARAGGRGRASLASIKLFCDELSNKGNLRIKAAYLFGSVVNGRQYSYSDIDLAIVSDSFTGFKFKDREKMNPYILRINPSIEAHPFLAKEFNLNNPFAREIIKTGKKIY